MTASEVKKDAVQYDVSIVWQPTDAATGHVAYVCKCATRCAGWVGNHPKFRTKRRPLLPLDQDPDLRTIARELDGIRPGEGLREWRCPVLLRITREGAGNPEAATPTQTPEERQRLPVWRDGGRASVLHDKLWLSTSRTDRPQVPSACGLRSEVDARAVGGPERSHGIR